MTRSNAIALIFIAVACLFFVAKISSRVSLIPHEILRLSDKPIAGNIIGNLKANDEVAVVRCEDIKHYIVPVIEVNGKEAYVVDGEFSIKRKKIWDFDSAPLSFSCP